MKSLAANSVRRLLLLLLLGAAVACAWLAPLDAAAQRQVDAGLKRALVSFAAARTLNAIISVAQGTEVSLQPLGVGLTLGVGQVLDPVNDLVEQFSSLMLAASVAFGMQKVLMGIGAHWLVSLLLTGVAAAWAVLLFRQLRSPAWLTQCLVVLLLLRFAIPVVTIASDLAFQQFMAGDYASSQQILERTATRVQQASPAETPVLEKPGLVDQLKGWWGAQHSALKERFANLKQAAEQVTEHVVKLIVIFILQTLVIPVALLWLLVRLARRAFLR